MDDLKDRRLFLKANFLDLHLIRTDQQKNLPQPPLQKDSPRTTETIPLVPWHMIDLPDDSLKSCIEKRRSHRNFTNQPLTLSELSFLLWSTQGVKEVITRQDRAYATLRSVPSAGARHPFETYLIILNVEGLQQGVYRYLPLDHELLKLFSDPKLADKINEATFGQDFCGKSAAVFLWSAIPYRMEWRYSISAHKVILLDCGHVCQNLYLAAEAIQAGTCAIGAYHQDKVDQLIQLDGHDEFIIYLAPVGKI